MTIRSMLEVCSGMYLRAMGSSAAIPVDCYANLDRQHIVIGVFLGKFLCAG